MNTTDENNDIGWVIGGFFIAFFVTLIICIICIAPFVIRWILQKVILFNYSIESKLLLFVFILIAVTKDFRF